LFPVFGDLPCMFETVLINEFNIHLTFIVAVPNL